MPRSSLHASSKIINIFLLVFSHRHFIRYTFGEFNTGIVFAYIGFIYIAKHMGFVKSKKFDGIETGNVTAVQQCARCTRSEGIFHHITGEHKSNNNNKKKELVSTEMKLVFIYEYIFYILQQILLKGTSRTNITLKPISFKAVLSLSIRPLTSGNFTENLMSMFLVHILSTPALIYQIETNVPDSLQIFQTHSILERSLDLLEKEQNMKIITNSMKGTQSLALLANLIHLFHLEPIETATKFGFPTFTVTN